MKPALDLTKIAWTKPSGDITLFGTWFGENNRPCMVLVPTYRSAGGWLPCVVLLDDAWRWDSNIGQPGYVSLTAPAHAIAMGFDPTPQLCARIANLIADHISDLLEIPPKPVERVVVADAILTDEHGNQRHTEITEAV